MIIGRSPLRISLGGGGTDLPSYFRDHEGFLVAAAIDSYVYVSMHRTFNRKNMLIRYSKIEEVATAGEIEHPIIREALKLSKIDEPNIEITSMADIPAGTGLGSSGSFTTCLLKVLHGYKGHFIETRNLAEMACHIELDLLGEPIGKQDQYISAFGGISKFCFKRDGTVETAPLNIEDETRRLLEENLLIFSTGYNRSASSILAEQDEKCRSNNAGMIENLHYVKDLGYRSCEALESGDLAQFGALMHEHWEQKKRRSERMSNPDIDKWYSIGRENGAVGGKLIGAGAGGFLMFYTEHPMRLREALTQEGLMELRFRFDAEGSKIIT